VSDPLPDTPGSGKQVEQSVGRDDQVGLHHLNIEADAYYYSREQQPAQPARLSRTQDCPGSQQQSQGQGTINGNVAIGHHTDRTQRQSESRQQASYYPKVTSYQVIEQGHREHACQRLWHKHTEGAEAEKLGTSHLQPETQRRLVDRHEAAWIIGGKKESMPIVHHASDCGGIIRGEAIPPQLKEVHEDRNE
jgi:hypothetical protein